MAARWSSRASSPKTPCPSATRAAAPAQIGVSGGNVTFGGTVIGTATGGTGATLTVTFNASATSAAIEALIENLTYANSSDTPTASRTLEILVTDADGPVPPAFSKQTGTANPFNPVEADWSQHHRPSATSTATAIST